MAKDEDENHEDEVEEGVKRCTWFDVEYAVTMEEEMRSIRFPQSVFGSS